METSVLTQLNRIVVKKTMFVGHVALVEPCTSFSQCAPGEYCCNGTCTLNCPSCSYGRDCPSGKYCCDLGQGPIGECARSCIGKSCKDYSDCGYRSGAICCDLSRGICASRSCVGKSCQWHDDCGSGEYCCGSIDNRTCSSLSCIGKFCTSNSGCTLGEYCCDRGRVLENHVKIITPVDQVNIVVVQLIKHVP